MDTRGRPDSGPPRSRRAQSRVQSRVQSRRRSTSRPGIAVIAMTAAALIVVAALAVQANGSQPSQVTAAPTTTTHGTSSGTRPAPNQNALPPNSGSGTRLVYSLSARRVWLVTGAASVQNTLPVVPGTTSPSPGTYQVSSRQQGLTGADGISVVYVVLFGDSFGFDAEAHANGMPAPPTKPTKGIRTSQDNALLIWNFTSDGSTIVVTP